MLGFSNIGHLFVPPWSQELRQAMPTTGENELKHATTTSKRSQVLNVGTSSIRGKAETESSVQ